MGPYEQKEIAWRISKVIVLPILMIFALSLGRVEPRSNRYVSMFSALLIYFTYTNLVTMACARVPAGGFSAWVMLGCMHLIFASVAVYLLWCRTRGRPVISLQRVKAASA
jgi:lipopolysaccharide export system permease protein